MLAAIKEIFATLINISFIFISYLRAEFEYFYRLVQNKSYSLVLFIILRLIRIYLDVFTWITAKVLTRPQKGKVPPIIDRLLLQSAQELSQQIKSGKLKSEVLVKAYIDRIKTVQTFINATVDQRFAEAVLEAIEIDKRVQHELFGNDPLIPQLSINDQPLLGIPFSCKDSIAIEGLAFDGGLESRKGVKAKSDAKVIQLLRDSGAIPIVLTNIPEILMWWNSSNKIYGQTNNPYDLSLSPGGSSGGEGALISSAGSLIGVGSDIGGSIRIPSAFCGIFGHKPTPGLVPTDNQYPLMTPEKSPFFTIGPMARYASDILPMLKAMAAPNVHKVKLEEKVDFSKLKIYYMFENNNPFDTKVSSDIKHSIKKIVSHMSQKYGSYTQKVNFDKFSHSALIWIYALKQGKVPSIEKELSEGNGSINVVLEIIKYFLNRSKHTLTLLIMNAFFKWSPSADTDFGQKYVRLGRELKQEFKQLLGNDGVLIYPTHPEPAIKHFSSILKFSNICYTAIFNVLGVPATNCPLGLNKDGLPISVQIVSTQWNDHLTIAVANELEQAFGGWVSPSKIVC